MRFRERMARFFYGRYGMDRMVYGQLIVCIILSVVNLFFHSTILQVVEMVLIVWAIFRMFSKNIDARRKENEVFERLWDEAKFEGRRVREYKTHVYRKCPHCGKMLRFPHKKGSHSVNCPVCHEAFKVKIRF